MASISIGWSIKRLIGLKHKSKPSRLVKLSFKTARAIAYFNLWLAGTDGDCFRYDMKGFIDSFESGLQGPAMDCCPLSIRFASQSKSSSKQILNDIYASL